MCYFAGIFYAVVRQISMLFIDNKDSVVCILLRFAIFREFSLLTRGLLYIIIIDRFYIALFTALYIKLYINLV